MTVPSSLQLQDLYTEIEEDAEIQVLFTAIRKGQEVKKRYAKVIPQKSKYIEMLLQEGHYG